MSLLREIRNHIDTRLNAGNVNYDGDIDFYYDIVGQQVRLIPNAINPLKIDVEKTNLYSLNSVTPDTQPFANRNINTYVMKLDVLARIEDRITIEDDLERFKNTFYNDIVLIGGLKTAFKVTDIVPIGNTKFENGIWKKQFSGTISVQTGKNVHFADEDKYEISLDDTTFEEVQLISYIENRVYDTLSLEGIGETGQKESVKQTGYQEQVSFVRDDTSVIQDAILNDLRTGPTTIFYTRLTEGTQQKPSNKMIALSNTNTKQNGNFDRTDLTFKEVR